MDETVYILIYFLLEGIVLGIISASAGLVYLMRTTDPAPKRVWIKIFLEFFWYMAISFWVILALLCSICWVIILI